MATLNKYMKYVFVYIIELLHILNKIHLSILHFIESVSRAK